MLRDFRPAGIATIMDAVRPFANANLEYAQVHDRLGVVEPKPKLRD
jgi:hypothetical protein